MAVSIHAFSPRDRESNHSDLEGSLGRHNNYSGFGERTPPLFLESIEKNVSVLLMQQ